MYGERSGADGARVESTRLLFIEARIFFLNSEVSLMLQFFRTYFFCGLEYLIGGKDSGGIKTGY